MPVPKDLLEVLACPKCKDNLYQKGMFLVCKKCELAYPVLDSNVPDMLIEDAWPLQKAKRASFKHNLKL